MAQQATPKAVIQEPCRPFVPDDEGISSLNNHYFNERQEINKTTPNNAYSAFTRSTRLYITYLLGFTMTLSILTATIYFPLIPLLSSVLAAISPGIFASLADTSGRRPVLLGLVGLYVLASLGLTLNKGNYHLLVAMRALQSVGGSPMPAIGYGVAADLSPTAERGKMIGAMMGFCNGLSAVGPVIAGVLASSTGGYVWVFVVLVVISGVTFVLIGFTMPETARVVVGNGEAEVKGLGRTWWSLLTRRRGRRAAGREIESRREGERPRWRPLSMLVSLRIILYPDAAAVLWVVASSYCVYYTFQVAIPTIFDDIYGYNDLFIGLAFLPGLAGMTIGGIVAGRLVDHNYARTAEKHNVDPEMRKSAHGIRLGDFPSELARHRRCEPFLLLQILLVAGYGWAVYFRLHPAVPLVMQFLCCFMSTLLSHTASALLVDIFPDSSSSAYASGQIMRCGLSAASAAALQPLVDAVGRLCAVRVSKIKGMGWRRKRLGE
ncbi:major facilitator superfamily domain-containing protein [Podospora aff. communis PSN243]|uniref:Major facilitator superfamily domain-containing protein n=1 Tax=Podospora aff. communis PSN243 TaxID=3040156 RepID=A0AAV9GED8_9PEZI|nr:major facilitator superfamily domain-containing protein [Podospora aff. communis PSN243]